MITAAAVSPATTNTADNPNQAFGLIVAAGATPVTVQSPPVVNFTVIDSTGKFVPGLTLVNPVGSAAGLAADANCSGNNVTFGIAKLNQPTGSSPSNWQSLISRQRYAADDLTPRYGSSDTAKLYATYRYAVAEGTADPKPTAAGTTITKADGTTSKGQFANPDTATTDPSTRIVGILEEDAAGGYYTYRFATDVVTPLLLKDAADVKNVSLGKVANNGNLAVKDGKTIHRVGAQLCYTDPVTKAKVVVNPYFDFTLDANGIAVPVTAADGKTLAAAKKVVDKTSCNGCHEKLAAHGTRVDPNYCVICHNPGSTDYNTNNPIDLKLMAHRIHMGKELTKDYQVASLRIKFTDKNGVVTGTGFPQDQRNCTACHDNKVAAQADNWKNVPSRNSCGACHDGIDFATGAGTTLAGATTGHVGGAKSDDTRCVLCHDAATIPVNHRTAVATTHNSTAIGGVATFTYELSSVTLNASRQPVIGFRIKKDGTAVTSFAIPAMVVNTSSATVVSPTYEPIANFTGGPSLYVAYAVPQDNIAAPADFNAYSSVSLVNLLVAGTLNQGTLTGPDADGFWTATLIGPATAPITVPATAKMVTGAIIGTFTQKNVTGYPYTPANVTAAPTTSASGGLVNKAQLKMLLASGITGNTARRAIVDTGKCNVCHEQLGTKPEFHGGARNDATSCAICHNPNRTSSGWSADSTSFVHGIHGASKRTVPYNWHAVSATDNYSQVGYPGILKNCETCHLPGTYDFSATTSASAVSNRLYRTVATGKFNAATNTAKSISPYVTADNVVDYGKGFSASSAGLPTAAVGTTLVISPIAAACFSCHDSSAAQAHMNNDGGGSIYRDRTTALALTERCLTCHGAGAVVDIKAMHAK